jgi:putative ABC transport system ATP-binding protein
MVTHDPRYARHASRTVHLFDGRIVEEEEAARKEQEARELNKSGFEVV